jgi:MraZ protein
MLHLLGEFECRIDAKQRLTLPVGLLRQLPSADQGHLVINRGFERHLVLYPISEWQKISQEINQLNLYQRRNREFARYFYRGASELKPDSQQRILLPKRLLHYAEIQDCAILFAYANRIEVWSPDRYTDQLGDEPEDFAELAETIMGHTTQPSTTPTGNDS